MAVATSLGLRPKTPFRGPQAPATPAYGDFVAIAMLCDGWRWDAVLALPPASSLLCRSGGELRPDALERPAHIAMGAG